MAGLGELYKKEILEDQPTSSVPKVDSDLAEPYDPSAARGLAGIALAGAGAVALRTPIGRALKKITSLTTPKLPVSRIKEPVDEVEEILTIAPTKVERGQLMTRPQISQQEQIRQEAIQKSNELKKLAYNNPLSRGGKTNRIGSSLWDYIARHPIAGARKPEEWIKDFKSGGPGSFKTGNPNFKSINQSVKKEELWDSNLVQFDKDGNVVGGFLKTAMEKKIPLTKMDLLYIVEKAPVNNLKMRKLRIDPKIVDDAEEVSKTLDATLGEISTKISNIRLDDATQAQTELFQRIVQQQKDLRKINARFNNQFRVIDGDDSQIFNDSELLKVFDEPIENVKALAEKASRLGVGIDPNEVTSVTNFAKNLSTDVGRRLQLQQTQGMVPKYGGYSDYRTKGGDEYFENVVYYPRPLPYGQKLPADYNAHYRSEYGITKSIPNQVYHTRGSIRNGGANPRNQKVMLIDEIQSDYHQKLRKENPARDKVVNAFGNEIEFFSANRKLEKLVDEMTSISRKGIRMTPDDMKRFDQLKTDFGELRKNSLNVSNISSAQAQEGIPFLPLHGKENWGAHALKNQLKDAADQGLDYVAITPVEYLHHAKRTRYLGDIEFYGTRTGKAGFEKYGGPQGVVRRIGDRDVPIADKDGKPQFTDPKKMATLPAVMKRLAQQYNSEVKTIPVAKSNPDRPYKVIKKVEGTQRKQFGLNPDKTNEHIAAFRTEQEAQYYSGRYGGDVKFISGDSPENYMDAFAIKVTPEMASKPFKAYQSGGLVVNIFA